MFIAPDHAAQQRRSEERNESSEYHSSCVPLLRTALRTLSSRSYKHDTPAGVKTSAFRIASDKLDLSSSSKYR